MVLEFFSRFQNHPNFFSDEFFTNPAGIRGVKEVLCLIPQSNISYKTIKSNRTLFECVGKECFEAEEENEEEIVD